MKAAVDAAVAADEANTDVDIKALADQITAALAPVTPAIQAAKKASS